MSTNQTDNNNNKQLLTSINEPNYQLLQRKINNNNKEQQSNNDNTSTGSKQRPTMLPVMPYSGEQYRWAESRIQPFGVNVCHPWLEDALNYPVLGDFSMFKQRMREWFKCRRDGIETMPDRPVPPPTVFKSLEKNKQLRLEQKIKEEQELQKLIDNLK